MTKRTKAVIITASTLAVAGLICMAAGSALGGSFTGADSGISFEFDSKNKPDNNDRYSRGNDDYYDGSQTIPYDDNYGTGGDEFNEFFRDFGFGNDFFNDFFGGSPYDGDISHDRHSNGSIHYY